MGVSRAAYLVAAGALLICLPLAASASVVTIPDVPSYIWYYGCGPTAAGMIVGYWDAHGYPDLITAGDGTNSWVTNQQAVKDMIASPGHIRDYWGYGKGMDRVATPSDPYHPGDCVADSEWASRGSFLADGESFDIAQPTGLVGYFQSRGYMDARSSYAYYSTFLWDTLVAQTQAARPMEFYVDSSGDGKADHFVTVVGYDDAPGARKYAALNTYDHDVHWYSWASVASGQSYGVASGTYFLPTSAANLTWQGAASNSWEVDGPANWKDNWGGVRAFRQGDYVLFGDTGASTVSILIAVAVEAGTWTVDNTGTDYTFTGPGSVGGTCGLVKRGTGRLTLTTANPFSGEVDIQAGVVVVSAAGALGTAAVRLDVWGDSHACLLVDGPIAIAVPIYAQGEGGGTGTRTLGGTHTAGTATFSGGLTVEQDLTLTAAPGGTVSLTGPLDDLAGKTLTKIGAGTLVIDGSQEYGPGSVWNVDEGAVFMQTDAGTETTSYLTVNVGGAGTDASVIFGADEHLAMLHIMSSGVATLGAGCHVLVLDSLWIDGFGPPLTHVSLYNTPEPATLLLLAGGGLLLLLRQRRGQ
jgi:autotransporter-associated beta strand protein